MKDNTRYSLITIGIVALLFLGTVVLFTDSMPIVVQRVYYSIVYKISPTAKSPEFLRKIHIAHPPKSGKPANPYSFDYTQADKPTIIKDSMLCEACHGSMRQEEDGKPKYYIHNKMLSQELVDFYCTNCHKRVDLGRRTPAHATIRVDRQLCTRCHEQGEKVPEMELEKIQAKLTKKDPNTYLVARHGTDKTAGLEWIKNHPHIAKKVGVDKCRRCHKKGRELNICRDCHAKDPEDEISQ